VSEPAVVKKRYHEAVPEIDVEEFRKVVQSRRSVRRFDDTPIPEAVLDDCLDMALLAPNSSDLQPWEFYVVRDAGLRRQLAHACLSQNAAKTAQVLVAVVARTGTWSEHCDMMLEQWPEPAVPKIVENYYARLAKIHYRPGPFNIFGLLRRALMTLAGFRRPVPRGPFTHADMKVWAAKSTALAAENFMLALRAHGFDSCPMEGFDENRVRRLLKLPGDGSVIMMVGAGKRAADGVYHARIRFDRNRFIHKL
jgi:nitroreductase